jgi:hypothetical protein
VYEFGFAFYLVEVVNGSACPHALTPPQKTIIPYDWVNIPLIPNLSAAGPWSIDEILKSDFFPEQK